MGRLRTNNETFLNPHGETPILPKSAVPKQGGIKDKYHDYLALPDTCSHGGCLLLARPTKKPASKGTWVMEPALVNTWDCRAQRLDLRQMKNYQHRNHSNYVANVQIIYIWVEGRYNLLLVKCEVMLNILGRWRLPFNPQIIIDLLQVVNLKT